MDGLHLAPGVVIAERFRLERVLGKGGMGSVWLAQQTSLDVPCAVKFIHGEAARSAQLRARFEREAKAAAQLRSPYVVQILDHGVWEDTPYIAMELLDGEDLEHRIVRRGKLSPEETMAVALHVGRALTKAHAAGLVHRDLKPANVFLVRDEEREIAKVLDFGVAKQTNMVTDDSTKTGAVLGTPYYMSPEQARGAKTVDHRSDLWALAVVVYRCVLGQLPFRSEVLGDLFAKIIADPMPVPSAAGPVPAGFDAWWARAAARDPAQRFQSAKEMTEALGLALGVTVPFGGDVAAHVEGRPHAPSGGATTPVPPGAPTPVPLSTPPQQAAPASGATAAPFATSTPEAAAAPRKSRAPIAAAILAAVVLGGGGAYALLRTPRAASPPPVEARAVTAAPAPPAADTAVPSQVPASSARQDGVPTASASVAAPAPATARAATPTPMHAGAPAPPAKAPPHSSARPKDELRPKDEFGI